MPQDALKSPVKALNESGKDSIAGDSNLPRNSLIGTRISTPIGRSATIQNGMSFFWNGRLNFKDGIVVSIRNNRFAKIGSIGDVAITETRINRRIYR